MSNRELREEINRWFGTSDLMLLSANLGIDYGGDLAGETKSLKILSLVEYLKRRERLEELCRELERERPHVNWRELIFGPASPPVPVMSRSDALAQLEQLMSERFFLSGLQQLVRYLGVDYESTVRQSANKVEAIHDIVQHAERDGWTIRLLEAIIGDFEKRLHSPLKESEIAKIQSIQGQLQ